MRKTCLKGLLFRPSSVPSQLLPIAPFFLCPPLVGGLLIKIILWRLITCFVFHSNRFRKFFILIKKLNKINVWSFLERLIKIWFQYLNGPSSYSTFLDWFVTISKLGTWNSNGFLDKNGVYVKIVICVTLWGCGDTIWEYLNEVKAFCILVETMLASVVLDEDDLIKSSTSLRRLLP